MNIDHVGTFVAVGNAIQPFARLIDAVVENIAALPTPVVLQYGNTPIRDLSGQSYAFLRMPEFERLICSAELLFVHGGAGTVIQAIRANKVPIVMPRKAMYGEVIDDHQSELAHELEVLEKVVLVEGPDQVGEAIKRALHMQRQRSSVPQPAALVCLVAKSLEQYARRG